MDNAETSGTAAVAASSLVASDRVDGFKVVTAEGTKLGTIRNFMIEKRTGQVAFVVLSTGGFLGLGQAYHPLPWSSFRFDEAQDAYVTAVDKQTLAGAPSYRPDTAPVFDDAYGRRIVDYYRAAAS